MSGWAAGKQMRLQAVHVQKRRPDIHLPLAAIPTSSSTPAFPPAPPSNQPTRAQAIQATMGASRLCIQPCKVARAAFAAAVLVLLAVHIVLLSGRVGRREQGVGGGAGEGAGCSVGEPPPLATAALHRRPCCSFQAGMSQSARGSINQHAASTHLTLLRY